MSKDASVLGSSVGRKIIMGLSGLFLCSFLLIHLYINLFLLKQDGGQTFDVYAEFMSTYPLIRPLEIVLFAGFLVHAGVGLWLWIRNRRIRPRQYEVQGGSATASFSSRMSFVTGVFVLLFLTIHVKQFFINSRFLSTGQPMHEIVSSAFVNPLYVLLYLAAFVVLGYHLKHGFQSAFQTFGLLHGKYKKVIDGVGFIFWFLIPLAFASIPIYFYLTLHSAGH